MKVSVIVTAYNYGKYIERCLRSLLDQNFPKNAYEIVVVDDCSPDETPQVMERFKDVPNIRYIRNQTNLGVAGSANVGIKNAMGQYVVRVDADDYVSANFVLYLSDYLSANHDAFCVSCDYVYVNEREEKVERLYASERPVSCGIMYRKDLLIEYGMYNDEWRHREEEELRKRLGTLYRIHHLRMPLYRYRKHKSNKTLQLDMMEQFREKLENISSLQEGSINLEKTLTIPRESLTDLVTVVIPARGGSQRLPRKNIYPIWGKPMICWAIDAAKKSKYVKKIVVSTEDQEIKDIALKHGAEVVDRPPELARSQVYKHDVICHAVRTLKENGVNPTLVVSLQPNSPEVQSKDIDAGIDHLLKHGKQEVMSVDENLNQNAAIRIMTQEATFQKTLSTNFGVFVVPLEDVHTVEDVAKLEKKVSRK